MNEQLAEAKAKLKAIIVQLEAAPAGQTKPRDAAILHSLPGVGHGVLATLFAEADDALRRQDYPALRCLCGVAPVTKRSGKSRFVHRRLAAHRRLRDAAYHWARVAVQRDPVSRAKYDALRARGHGHARSLRSVADRLLGVCLRNAPRRHALRPAAGHRRGKPHHAVAPKNRLRNGEESACPHRDAPSAPRGLQECVCPRQSRQTDGTPRAPACVIKQDRIGSRSAHGVESSGASNPIAAAPVRISFNRVSGKDPPRDASERGVAGQAVADRRPPPVTRTGT